MPHSSSIKLPSTLPDLLAETVISLSSVPPSDSILTCPASTLAILSNRPASLIQLAHEKIHSLPFSEVPECWRRLFTDASIYEAVGIIRAETERRGGDHGNWIGNSKKRKTGRDSDGEEAATRDDGDDWIQTVVKLLDMAIIMAGAPHREKMIGMLLLALENLIQEQEGLEERKRSKTNGVNDFFSENIKNAPNIRYPIPKSSALSALAFEAFLEEARPLIIQGALEHWPALRDRPWKSLRYLMERTLGGRRLIPVEVGRSYTDEGWGQKIITFGEFVDEYLIKESNEGEEDTRSNTGYLAQHNLFAQVPSLRADISIPDYCFTDPPPPASGTPLTLKEPQPKLEEPLLNAWFGPAGTISPLHTDPYHNILCQVVGKKYVRLYDPHETGKLYPKDVEEGGVDMSNTSEVDVEGNAKEREATFPLFNKARYVETILSEGECLYIPVGWWHYVRSLTVSFSVSFWWN
ncbi:hypothetical protein ACLMJK_007330 [Lecanora helva]